MATIRSSKALYEAAKEALYQILVEGKQSAQVGELSFTSLDVDKLQRIAAFYKSEAEAEGEIVSDTIPPTVTIARIRSGYSNE
jgi:hypothetical protein